MVGAGGNVRFTAIPPPAALVRAGTNFVDGVQEDPAKNVTRSTDNEPREAA